MDLNAVAIKIYSVLLSIESFSFIILYSYYGNKVNIRISDGFI